MTDSSMKNTNIDILSSKPYFEDLKALKEGRLRHDHKEKYHINPISKVSKVINAKELKIKETSTPNIRLVGIHENLAFAKKKSWALQINNALSMIKSTSAPIINETRLTPRSYK